MLDLVVIVRAVVSHEELIGPGNIGESQFYPASRGAISIVESSGPHILVATIGKDVVLVLLYIIR